jgi:putative ABC transport system substrate-binding protein
MSICLRRREFIAAFGGAAAWPLAARAQQGGRMRRIGALMSIDENDPLAKSEVSAFTQALADLGWTDGRNVQMHLCWAGPDNNRIRAFAQELVSLRVDIILTSSTPPTVAGQRETRDPDRLCEGGRSRRQRHRRAARPPRWERHRLR